MPAIFSYLFAAKDIFIGIIIGIPPPTAASNSNKTLFAFAISKRLGLGDTIINRANEILSDDDIKFEDVISDLEESRLRAHSEMEYAKRLKR